MLLWSLGLLLQAQAWEQRRAAWWGQALALELGADQDGGCCLQGEGRGALHCLRCPGHQHGAGEIWTWIFRSLVGAGGSVTCAWQGIFGGT